MSRTHRASIATAFAYAQFALSMTVGIVLIRFVLHRVDTRLYGYWLASGEVLAYAAMADLGVMGILPWLVAEADGRQDREGIRRVLSAGFWCAAGVAIVYLALAAALWQFARLGLQPHDRAAIGGPLAVLACATALVMPMKIWGSVLAGLQDVKFHGAITTMNWAISVIVTVALLLAGQGLYALALGAAVPAVVIVIATFVRARVLAPDLMMSTWPRPTLAEVARLFREGFGGWLGAWGWRLSAASDAIVLAWIGMPIWIIMLAMTAKLGQMLMQMAWVPGDSSLVGLAQLSGEQQIGRVRAASVALLRVYLTLATAGTCVVLAVNGAFVRGWVGEQYFAGAGLNAVIAAVILISTVTHGLSAIASVLGKRTHVGLGTLVSGGVQVGLALFLAGRIGLVGVPLAALLAQCVVLLPLVVPAVSDRTGLGYAALMRDVVAPWTARSLPCIALCALGGPALSGVPLWVSIPLGGAVGLAYLTIARRLLLDYPPVAALIRARLSSIRLERLVPLAEAERPQLP